MKAKFKAKRSDGKGWVEGNLVETNKFTYILNVSFIPAKSLPSDHFIEVIPETVCIGTETKQGWVFSGDKMKHPDLGLGIVSFDGFGFMITYPDEDNYCIHLYEDISELELTSKNIHD